jgi:hypothetical protein
MRNIVDLMFIQERLIDDPRRIRHDLVNPATMSHGLAALRVGQDSEGFMLRAEVIGADSNNEMYRRKRKLGLPKLERMGEMKDIVDPIRIHSYWPPMRGRVGFVSSGSLPGPIYGNSNERPDFFWC